MSKSKGKKNCPSPVRNPVSRLQWRFGRHLSLPPLTGLLELIIVKCSLQPSVLSEWLETSMVDYLLSLICTSELEEGKDDLMPIFKEWRIFCSALAREQTKEARFTYNRRGLVVDRREIYQSGRMETLAWVMVSSYLEIFKVRYTSLWQEQSELAVGGRIPRWKQGNGL